MESEHANEGDFKCIFNPHRFGRDEIRELLANDAAKLLETREPLGDTSHAHSYAISIDGQRYFAKEFTTRKWYYRPLDLLRPQSFRNFKAAGPLLKADLRTPTPALAAVLTQSRPARQILVTDYCEDATSLEQYFEDGNKEERREILAALADLLSNFHHKGFYSGHLRAGNLLMRGDGTERQYWFIDLDQMSSTRWCWRDAYARTVSRGCAEIYAHLGQDERNFLLKSCFDFALKKNIFSRPSQQERFVEKVIALIHKRNP